MSHAEYCAQFVTTSRRVLDVGSGRGKFSCAMAKLGYRVTGIEVNAEYIAESQKLALQEGLEVEFIKGTAESLPFANNLFGFVNAAEVTEHVENPIQMCREVYRVLENGGSGYLSFHNRWGLYDYHYHLYGINWLPRSWAEYMLRLLKKQKEDGLGYLTSSSNVNFNNISSPSKDPSLTQPPGTQQTKRKPG